MKKLKNFSRGMGIGGWLTNYKRFNVLPPERRMMLTVGDLEHFESYITERDVEYIASLGLDHIRLGFDQIVLESAPFEYNEAMLGILKKFVGWCKKYGLGVVLNLHKAVGNYCDIASESGLMESAQLMERFVALWKRLEQEFHEDGEVMFELLNEVVNATAEQWNALADKTVRALRELNTERKIIVGCVEWGSAERLAELTVWEDENIIYTFHCYVPYEFTHQRGVLQAAALFYNRDMPYPCDDIERYREYYRLVEGFDGAYPELTRMDIEYLRKYLSSAKEWIDRHPDKILWCGEFGTIRHAKPEWRESWMRDVISILKEWEIPWCVWNYLSTPNDGNRFSLVDDDKREILSDRLHKIILGDFL